MVVFEYEVRELPRYMASAFDDFHNAGLGPARRFSLFYRCSSDTQERAYWGNLKSLF